MGTCKERGRLDDHRSASRQANNYNIGKEPSDVTAYEAKRVRHPEEEVYVRRGCGRTVYSLLLFARAIAQASAFGAACV